MSTGADGAFVLNHAMTINGRTVVRFEKQGYFPLTRSGIFADEMHLDVLMQAKGNSGNSVATSFAADRTATLSAGGMKVDIPASSLTADDGKAYTGSVNADMFYLDPNSTGFASLMPGGDLAGISVGNGEAQLISYGMTAVLLTDNAGRALQLKKDAAAELTFPIPVGMDDNPPAEIPLWSFDEERGVWIEEGRATRQGNVYTGTAKHFSWINLDAPADRVTISGRLTDCNGDPVQRAKVTVGQVATSSDSRGDYSAFVPANTPVVVRVEGSGFSDGVEHAISAQRGGTTVTQDFSLPCRTASSVDKAVIFYSVDGGKNNAILTFDNNGRRMRWDTDYGTKNHLAIIVDELSRTYIMGVAGSWAEMSYENGLIESVFAMFLFNDEQYSKVPGYARLPGETIAEQLCTMISYPALNNCTQKYGGWHGMIMLNENCEKIIQRATEVRFDVPENTFTKTMDIFD
ncbi:MAG: carboxypeptidase-like regulatory domain-containing protein [Tannerella sp.]|nr:carboxypeptidase-like regulatory domain-containing protein [Tannerella sp.]